MLKLSINLPNNAQINLESEDEVVIDRILGIVLADVTRALLAGIPGPDLGTGAVGPPERPAASPVTAPSPLSIATEVESPTTSTAEAPPQPAAVSPNPASGQEEFLIDMVTAPQAESLDSPVPAQGPDLDEGEAVIPAAAASSWSQSDLLDRGTGASNGAPPAGGNHQGMANLVPAVSEQAFIDFCRAANPLGDMRRVVVAAEGASRYLAMDGVDAENLGRLFDIVGWPRAHNFVQTLRNAARSKFGWLERIPGRAGHYSVTDVGRSTALGR